MDDNKQFLVMIGLTIIIVCYFYSQLNTQSNKESNNNYSVIDVYFYKMKFEDHEYLALNRKGYFIHSESCPCKKGK